MRRGSTDQKQKTILVLVNQMAKKATILMRHALHKRMCGEPMSNWMPMIEEAQKWASDNYQPRLAAQAQNLINRFQSKESSGPKGP